jgi:hypothetical protein
MAGRKIRCWALGHSSHVQQSNPTVILNPGKHMILVSVGLFGLAVALGLYLVNLGVRHRRGSRALAAVHAGVALLGLGALVKVIFDGPKHLLYNDAALLFVFALLGGLVLLAVRVGEADRRAPPSMIGVSLHAAMALVALLLLVLGYARY